MDIKRTSAKMKSGETRLGVYVWEMPDGRWIGDEDNNFLSIASMIGNRERIAALANAVRHHGINEGQPKFIEGSRQIDDEEFEYQKQRLRWGLTPDPLDIGVHKDEMAKLRGPKK
jgi:hypothetical protein